MKETTPGAGIAEGAGTPELSANAAAIRKTKITINIDQDLLGLLRAEAARTGVPYQRLVNQMLRKAVQQDHALESRLDRLEKKVNKLKRKLAR